MSHVLYAQNKWDLEDKMVASKKEGEELTAKLNREFCEVSALTNAREIKCRSQPKGNLYNLKLGQ